MSISVRDRMALTEAATLTQLAQLKQQIVDLHSIPAKATYAQLSAQYSVRLEQLGAVHRQRKQQRDRQRHQAQNNLPAAALEASLAALRRESQQDGLEKRRLKQERAQALSKTAQQIEQANRQIKALKQQYATLSKEWQATMQRTYFETFDEKEQPPLSVLYRDEYLVVVNKPAGLLSVPGRRIALQDSAIARLQYQFLDCSFLQAVHRLDRDTSGVLAIAASPQAHAALSQQFAQRQVHKTYEAILSKPIRQASGTLSLPLWGDPAQRPKQTVDFQKGKPSQTDFKRLTSGDRPRVQLSPQTGRTHQLRVHTAHSNGLNAPILGDVLYGKFDSERLHLHATQLAFTHPVTKMPLRFESAVPF